MPKSILLIDDDEDFVDLFKALTLQVDPTINVISATTVVEGYLKAQKQRFAKIFTDYNLPHFSGVDFINTVRKIDENSTVPIVLVTTNPKEIELSAKLKDIYSLKKPINKNSLKDALSEEEPAPATPKEKVDTDLINNIITNYYELLNDVAYFDNIEKLETKKLDVNEIQDYDYFACVVIQSDRFNGILTMAFPEETLSDYFKEIMEQSDESKKDIFNAFVHILLSRLKEKFNEEGVLVKDVKSVVGAGGTELLTSSESFLEFCNKFKSSHGVFYIQISLWK